MVTDTRIVELASNILAVNLISDYKSNFALSIYICRGRDILQNDRMMSQVGKKKKVLETILSENHFRVPPTRAPTFRQGTTSTMETSTTRTICILCQGMRTLVISGSRIVISVFRDVLGSWKHYNLSRSTLDSRNRRETSPLVTRELDR